MDSKTAEGAGLGSNNPFRQSDTAATENKPTKPDSVPLVFDTEKQVVASETLSGSENAPTPVQQSPATPQNATREADKEVVDSWQTQSREQSAPISMVYHESNSARGDGVLNDVKGPPPAYDDLRQQHSSASGSATTSLTTPTSIEPDGPGDLLPPRPEDRSAVGQLLSWIPRAPQNTHRVPRLAQPVIIPQLDVPPQRESVPFQRCYTDALAASSVPIQEFTRFLDGLEVAQLPNSALQGLRMFGVGVQHVPIPILATVTGRGLSALGSSGSGHSGSRARLYLEQAKERYFQPRGLRVSIVKDENLNARLQIPSHAPRLGMLTQNTISSTCVQRRLEALAPYTTPLRFDVPDQDKQIQGVQKMARKHLHSRFKEKTRRIDTLRKRQWEGNSPSIGDWEERYRRKMGEVRAAQDGLIRVTGQSESEADAREAGEELKMRQHELQLLVSERQNAGRRDDAVAAEMEEVRWSGRLKWLVIESA